MKTRIIERPGTAATRSLPIRMRRRKEKAGFRRARQPQEKGTPLWNMPLGRYDPTMRRKGRSAPGALRHRVLVSAYQQRNSRPNGHTTGAQEQTNPDSELLRGRCPRKRRKRNRGIGPETPSALHSGNLRGSTTGTWSGHFSALLVDLSTPPARSVGIRRHEVQQPQGIRDCTKWEANEFSLTLDDGVAQHPEAKFIGYVSAVSQGEADPLEVVPEEFREYLGIMGTEAAEALSEHKSYDCKMDLKTGETAPWGPIYPLSEKQLETLCEWLKEMLRTGKI